MYFLISTSLREILACLHYREASGSKGKVCLCVPRVCIWLGILNSVRTESLVHGLLRLSSISRYHTGTKPPGSILGTLIRLCYTRVIGKCNKEIVYSYVSTS